MKHQFNDGGRKEAGRKGSTGDCVCRAIAIVTGIPYEEVYRKLAEGTAAQRKSKRTPKKARTASAGINVGRKWFKEYMKSLGFIWVPTMTVGSGCKVHLREDELPKGRLVVHVSKHSTAVIDGVIHDTYDPSREGTRCVYGYYIFAKEGDQVCPNCKGSGKWDCVATIIDKAGPRLAPAVRMNCFTCEGLGKVDPIEQERKKKEADDFWCSCGNPSGEVDSFDDGEGEMCFKHHYCCRDCGKVYQVG